MKKIALIGSTGSIGRQTLNVCRRHPDKFKIVSLAGGYNSTLLCEQVKEFNPLVVTSANPINFDNYKGQVYCGENAFTNAIIDEADIVVISLVGFNGITAVLDAIKKGKNIALANKESLVVGGQIVMPLAKQKGITITPIDSEHSAIWQALNYDFNTPFEKIILTASGGAFRDYTKEQLKTATSTQALKHPNWQMGAKITIDCATLVNKGFEVIEAHYLYNCSFDKIDVIIHRESIIHSMVEFKDKGVIAELSYPTMELPITLALTYPDRYDCGLKSLDFEDLQKLTFEKPDYDRFPCLKLIVDAGKKGGLYPAIANGANEMAVKLFLENKIKYNDIYAGILGALNTIENGDAKTYEALCEADRKAKEYIKKKFGV